MSKQTDFRTTRRFSSAIAVICFLLALVCFAFPAHAERSAAKPVSIEMEDGEYEIDVTLTGGSGRAAVTSPATLIVTDGLAYARIEWSSSHYDYMRIGEETFLPVNTDGNSVFEIPVTVLDAPMDVIADTTAMSVPHEIEYTLTFASASLTVSRSTTQDNPQKAVAMAAAILAICGMTFLFYHIKKRKGTTPVLIFLFAVMLPATGSTACGASADDAGPSVDISDELVYTGSMERVYARQFSVDYYEGGYSLITISGDGRFLVVPEGMDTPADLPEDIVVLTQPLGHIYLAASAVMDMFVSADALDSIRFSALDTNGWYIDQAKAAMQNGDILYAGKYSAPDYERILAEHCDLAIENTMIYHTPEVKEQLERLGIPVIVDHSSYETEPLGRTEWVRLYGLLTGKEAAAEAAFVAQTEALASIDPAKSAGKTVAFFYITTNGTVNVRKASDYLPKMIALAGGSYLFSDLGADDKTASSTVSMQMEEFYSAARNADYIIYNSTIDGELTCVDDLLKKHPLLENMKAIKEGHVYCTTRNLYQSSMELGTIISDIHRMLTGDDANMTYLYKVNQ